MVTYRILSLAIACLILILVVLLVYFYAYESNMITLTNTSVKDPDIVAAICEFEASMAATYPLGTHSFSIRHANGTAYFDFFARMGSYKYVCYMQNGKVLATACGVLRTISDSSEHSNRNSDLVWYICDLKVHPDLRGQHLPWRMFCKSFFPGCLQSLKGYGVTMLPPDTDTNRIVSMAEKQGFETYDVLCVYFITHAELRIHLPALQQTLGDFCFVDNTGKKDIILDGAPVNLLHIVRYRTDLNVTNAAADYYMFCVPQSHAVMIPLTVFSRARIVGYNMQDFSLESWDFINTAEI